METLPTLEYRSDTRFYFQRPNGFSSSFLQNRSQSKYSSPRDTNESKDPIVPFSEAMTHIECEPSNVSETCHMGSKHSNVRYVFDFPNTPMLHFSPIYTSGRSNSILNPLQTSQTAGNLNFPNENGSRGDICLQQHQPSEDKDLEQEFTVNSGETHHERENEIWPLFLCNEDEWTQSVEYLKAIECVMNSDLEYHAFLERDKHFYENHGENVSVFNDSIKDQKTDHISSLICNETLSDEDFLINGRFLDAPLSGDIVGQEVYPTFEGTNIRNASMEGYCLEPIQIEHPNSAARAKSPCRRLNSRWQKSNRAPGIYFEGSLLPDTSTAGRGNRGGTNQPSRFCHICLRRAERLPLMACSRLRNGLCRKVVCERCFEDFGYDWEKSAALGSEWICTHCSKTCPPRAQCFIYKRTNDRRHHALMKRRRATVDLK